MACNTENDQFWYWSNDGLRRLAEMSARRRDKVYRLRPGIHFWRVVVTKFLRRFFFTGSQANISVLFEILLISADEWINISLTFSSTFYFILAERQEKTTRSSPIRRDCSNSAKNLQDMEGATQSYEAVWDSLNWRHHLLPVWWRWKS